tara:strand:- start:3959 stop:4162 length:204 start_codon:yes stop_codon:yes gene_type:complete
MQAKTIEKSINWQRHVIAHSRDPVQIARCKAAIFRLEEETMIQAYEAQGMTRSDAQACVESEQLTKG